MHACWEDGGGRKYEDTNIKGADTESDFWLSIYSVTELSIAYRQPVA